MRLFPKWFRFELAYRINFRVDGQRDTARVFYGGQEIPLRLGRMPSWLLDLHGHEDRNAAPDHIRRDHGDTPADQVG